MSPSRCPFPAGTLALVVISCACCAVQSFVMSMGTSPATAAPAAISRRVALQRTTAAVAAVVSAGAAGPWALADDGGDGAEASGDSAASVAGPAAGETSISYLEFNDLLFKREVASAKFYGAKYEKCVLTLADGSEVTIGEGYPRESPATNESPMKVVAQLRNARVPFKADFNLRGYAKGRSYKSDQTLAAEDRQRDEDAAVERMLSSQ